MPQQHTCSQQQMNDLKALAELLGEVADRMPRRAHLTAPDRESLAMIGVALPRLAATCNALFENSLQMPRALGTGQGTRGAPTER